METETEEKALARIHIGELDSISIPGTDEKVAMPFYHCYVVTTAGQIWDAQIQAFGCTKEYVKTLWNSDRSQFKKREFTTTN